VPPPWRIYCHRFPVALGRVSHHDVTIRKLMAKIAISAVWGDVDTIPSQMSRNPVNVNKVTSDSGSWHGVGDGMRRPSVGEALAIAAVPAALACVAITIATFELAGRHNTNIWSNAWSWVTLVFGGIALLIAVIAPASVMLFGRSPDAADREPTDQPDITAVERTAKLYARSRVRPSTDRPLRVVRTTTAASGSDGWKATDTGTQVIAERLELALANGGICSARKTPGEPSVLVRLPLPEEKMLEDYRSALGAAAALTGPPDEVTSKRIRELVVPLQQMLMQAVPEPVRWRMTAEGGGAAAKLAAIELTLTDCQLERYPWELIADPASFGGSLPIAVWRSVLFPQDPPVRKQWTNNLLLTGRVAVPDELAMIKSELSGCGQTRVFDCPGIPSSFRPLLEEHPPAAFHLVAPMSTLKDLTIRSASLAADLGQSGVWVAVMSCRDSATVPSGEGRPPAYEIAKQSGAATIGMAGLTQPDMSGLFAVAFYHCLAGGFSALQAYHAAVSTVRNHGIYSTMWSIPVMYARTPNVIPFPTDDQARVRLGLEQVRFHVAVLGRELEDLEGRDLRSVGEWAKQAATPIVRTDCISEYLAAATACGPAAFPEERQDNINDARDELESALSETADSLTLLSNSRAGAQERRRALSKLPQYRIRHQRILSKLDRLIGDVR
jgi:hypothetical protein